MPASLKAIGNEVYTVEFIPGASDTIAKNGKMDDVAMNV